MTTAGGQQDLIAAVERDKRIYADDLHRDAVARAIQAEQEAEALRKRVKELQDLLKQVKSAARLKKPVDKLLKGLK